MIIITNKAQTMYDFLFLIIAFALAFLVFFSISEEKNNAFDNTLKYLTLTENAITKSADNSIAFAKYNLETYTTLQNTLDNIKIIDPIKKIQIINIETNIKIEEIGNIDCEKQFNISRLVIYNDEICKAIFYFCE